MLTVAVRWRREALSGVAALHSKEIVHRDLSPKNLLVRSDGTVIVADFGTVRHVDDETLTQDDARFGSLIYISRQQFEAPRRAKPCDDVYSLGQIAWQLFVGRWPLGNPPSLTDLCPDVSPALVALVERMRDDDAVKRPADAGVALTELEALPDVLPKPSLRRNSVRTDADGEPMHNPWSASVRAIEARQMDELDALGSSRGSASVVWALDLLVHQLGPFLLRGVAVSSPRGSVSPRDSRRRGCRVAACALTSSPRRA